MNRTHVSSSLELLIFSSEDTKPLQRGLSSASCIQAIIFTNPSAWAGYDTR